MANAFTIYWGATGWQDLSPGDPLQGAGGSHFLGKVSPGDRVYVTNVAGGVLRLLGAFTVGRITRTSEGQPPGVNWKAQEYLWPEVGTATEFAFRELPLELVSSLRFKGGADRVAMDRHVPGQIERNAMRVIRRLAPASAQVLEQALSTAPTEPYISGNRRHERLPAELIKQATPDLIFASVAALLGGTPHGFGESTDYDLITDEGMRLPPKAVFGHALSLALNREIFPKHFSAGEDSLCFRLLREAGYRIFPKGKMQPEVAETDFDQNEPPPEVYPEGAQALRQHISRERKPAAVRAKKADFIRKHGRLFCERCHTDPVEIFGSEHGEACIEIHHARIQVGDMPVDHMTRLEDLQCLCANCHRFVHRLLRRGLSIQGE
ncbi:MULTISPECIES: HNH endonuclease [Gammaproteobacteria]|uniref:HNH endonuclease n=1 Tax=Gammaproteobacteria TaxID=1236 RepID=UPI001FB023E3|nr:MULTISPECIES: hypothetical protein [Gammaproteobacteria]